MSKYYRLIDGVKSPQKRTVPTTSNKGTIRYRPLTLEPGKEYELPDDPRLIRSLETEWKAKKPYSQELIKYLKSNNIEYKIDICPVCGGRQAKKVVYSIIEFFEVED